MNRKIKMAVAIVLVGFSVACKDRSAEAERGNLMETSTVVADSSEVSSSEQSAVSGTQDRKFVRTADISFKVKDVVKSTGIIEDATRKIGGFITYTNLQSNISEEDKTQVSPDSTLVTTRFTIENQLSIRVPNAKMDTLINSISAQVGFLNYRLIKAEDVSLQLLANELSGKRNASSQNRLERAIDSKGKKLNQIVDAEETLANKKEIADNKAIETLALQDKVDFSTIAIRIYQDPSVKQELVANVKSINDFRPNIGLQIFDSFKTGWYTLEKIIAFVVLLWPFVLMGFLGYFGYQRFLKVRKAI